MGISFSSRFLGWLFPSEPVRITMVGLGYAGKTTTLYKMKLGQVVTTIPTMGFNVETFTFNNISLTVWDVGFGGGKVVPLWRHYFADSRAVIFVLDSCDRECFGEAKEALQTFWNKDALNPQIQALLIFASKQDLDQAMTLTEITEGLREVLEVDLGEQERIWHVEPCSGVTGEGLEEGFLWLSNQLKQNR